MSFSVEFARRLEKCAERLGIEPIDLLRMMARRSIAEYEQFAQAGELPPE